MGTSSTDIDADTAEQLPKLLALIEAAAQDMKSPLTTVMGLSQILLADLQNGGDKVSETDLQTINTAAMRLSEMLNNLSTLVDQYQSDASSEIQ